MNFENGSVIKLTDKDSKEQEFKIKKKLGSGSFGSVYQVEQNGTSFALKAVRGERNSGLNDEQISNAKKEAQLILENNELLKHKQIVTPIEIYTQKHPQNQDKKILFILMELVEGKTLQDKLGETRSMEKNMDIFIQLLKLVVLMHKHVIVHRDIKPANIILQEKYDKILPTIVDFGLAKKLSSLSETVGGTGTIVYIAPEIIEKSRGHVNTKIDIFGLGLILYQLMTRDPEFPEQGPAYHYIETNPQVYSKIKDQSLRLFLKKMLSGTPDTRPSAETLLNDSFIRGWELNLKFHAKRSIPSNFPLQESITFYSCFFSTLSERIEGDYDLFAHKITIIRDILQAKSNELSKLLKKCNLIEHICSSLLQHFNLSVNNRNKVVGYVSGYPGDSYFNNGPNTNTNTNKTYFNSKFNSNQLSSSSINNENHEKNESKLLKLFNLIIIDDDTKNIVAYQICSYNKLDIFIDLFKTRKDLQEELIAIFSELLSIPFFGKEIQRFQLEPIIINYLNEEYGNDNDDEFANNKLLTFYCKLPYHKNHYFNRFLNNFLSSTDFSLIKQISFLKDIFNNCKSFDKFDSLKPIIIEICDAFIQGKLRKNTNIQSFLTCIFKCIVIDDEKRKICLKHSKENAPAFCENLLISPQPTNITFFDNINFTTEEISDNEWKCSVGLSSTGLPYTYAVSTKIYPIDQQNQMMQRENKNSNSSNVMFYYELKISEMPKEYGPWSLGGISFISIGISIDEKNHFLQKIPTDFENEISYRSDGILYNDIDNTKCSFPCFGSGDVVGCGMDSDRKIFFTLNGSFLGYASKRFSLSKKNLKTCIHIHGQPAEFSIIYQDEKFLYDYNTNAYDFSKFYLQPGKEFICNDFDIKQKITASLEMLVQDQKELTKVNDYQSIHHFLELVKQYAPDYSSDLDKSIGSQSYVSQSKMEPAETSMLTTSVLNSPTVNRLNVSTSSLSNVASDKPIFMFFADKNNEFPSSIMISTNMKLFEVLDLLKWKTPNFTKLFYFSGEQKREIKNDEDLRIYFKEFLANGYLPFITLE